jgi:cell division protein ZapA (FtsZ GTPase activity inhibitor)
VKVTIAGHRFSVKTDAKPQYIKELASFVNSRLNEAKRKSATSQSAALLAAMTIADELYQLRDRQDRIERAVRDRTDRILRVLEQEAGG